MPLFTSGLITEEQEFGMCCANFLKSTKLLTILNIPIHVKMEHYTRRRFCPSLAFPYAYSRALIPLGTILRYAAFTKTRPKVNAHISKSVTLF